MIIKMKHMCYYSKKNFCIFYNDKIRYCNDLDKYINHLTFDMFFVFKTFQLELIKTKILAKMIILNSIQNLLSYDKGNKTLGNMVLLPALICLYIIQQVFSIIYSNIKQYSCSALLFNSTKFHCISKYNYKRNKYTLC